MPRVIVEDMIERASRVDTTSTVNVIYIGEADPGVSDDQPFWRIQKIYLGPPIQMLWAGGTDQYDKRWDQRLSLVYS